MDNLFELIILIVFILSGINSLFGSKKKRRNKIERPTGPLPPRNKVPRDETDLLEEIFGVKKERTPPNDPFDEPSVQKQNNYGKPEFGYDLQSTWNPEDDFKESSEIQLSDVTEREKIFDEISKIDYDKIIPPKNERLLMLQVDTQDDQIVNKKVIELRKKLKDKNTIKDSIIIAEILSKPKALRFRRNDLLG